MKKEKHFNIREINGTKPLNEWMEQGIQDLAKREYGMNITVKIKTIVKCRPIIDRDKWIVPYNQPDPSRI